MHFFIHRESLLQFLETVQTSVKGTGRTKLLSFVGHQVKEKYTYVCFLHILFSENNQQYNHTARTEITTMVIPQRPYYHHHGDRTSTTTTAITQPQPTYYIYNSNNFNSNITYTTAIKTRIEKNIKKSLSQPKQQHHYKTNINSTSTVLPQPRQH